MKQDSDKKRFRLTGGDRIVAIVILVLTVLTLVLSVVNALGFRLVVGEIYIILPMAALLLLLGWGMSALWRKMKQSVFRKVVGAVLILVMVLLLMLAMTYGSLYSGLAIPKKYAVVSEDGHSLVVMRALDPDQTRIDARHASRLAADPEGNPDITAEDWGYTYTAYARALMGLFYRADSLLEGEVHIGFASKAELMVEWTGDEGHFFIKNPEPGDEGEMRAMAR